MPEEKEERNVDGGDAKLSAELRHRLKEIEAQAAEDTGSLVPLRKIGCMVLVALLILLALWFLAKCMG